MTNFGSRSNARSNNYNRSREGAVTHENRKTKLCIAENNIQKIKYNIILILQKY